MAEINNSAKTGQERLCPDGYKSCDGYVIPNEWSIVRFSSLFKHLTRKNTENNQNVLTISAQQGLVNQMDYYNTLYASENKEGYSLLRKGDFSYNKSYSSDYAYGAIKRLDAYGSGIVSPLYICFTPEEGVNSDFYLQYFEAGRFNREIYKIAQEGARNHGLLNVSTEDFFNAALVFPPLAEQERIAEILMQCDKAIELCEKKLTEVQKLKKTCLRRMFPENGSKTPEHRFSCYTDNWKLSKIGAHARVLSAARVHKHEWAATGIPFFRSSDVVSAYKGTSNEKAFISVELYEELIKTSGKLERGDILVTGGGSIGIPYIVPDDTPLYSKDADLIWIKKSKDIDSMYLFAYLESAGFRKYIERISHVGTIAHYTIEQVKATPIALPSHDEQVQIGKFFQRFNNLICLYEQELEERRLHKKALSQLLLTGIVRTKA